MWGAVVLVVSVLCAGCTVLMLFAAGCAAAEARYHAGASLDGAQRAESAAQQAQERLQGAEDVYGR